MAYDSKEKRQAYAREHYLKNKELYKARAIKSKKEVLKRRHSDFRELKNRPCTDCGGRFHHIQMDWDHLPGQGKFLSVALMINRGFSDDKIHAEIAKCELVCANCHRLRTWQRNQAEVVE